MIAEDELRHLADGPRAGERPGGAGLSEVVVSGDAVDGVVMRVRDVLTIVVREQSGDAADDVDWSAVLPGWFVAACAPAEVATTTHLRELDEPERTAELRHRPWSLDRWVDGMDPDEERDWYWWDARVSDTGSALLRFEVDGFPFGSGPLWWLLRAAGADGIEFR